MWLCLNDAFVSVVQDLNNKDNLLVRARDAESIPRLFGTFVEVIKHAGTDYLYRASIPKSIVASTIAYNIVGIDYGNFKNSVEDPQLRSVYGNFWDIMYKYQERKEYGTQNYSDRWSKLPK